MVNLCRKIFSSIDLYTKKKMKDVNQLNERKRRNGGKFVKDLRDYCADVGVSVAAQDNFRGISVSGVGISCPVTVSGTRDVVTSLLLFNRMVGSGLLDDNLP